MIILCKCLVRHKTKERRFKTIFTERCRQTNVKTGGKIAKYAQEKTKNKKVIAQSNFYVLY